MIVQGLSLSKRMILMTTMLLVSALVILAIPQVASAYTLSNSTFNVTTGNHGEISNLQIVGDSFPTNYVMNAQNAPQQNTADHQWLGEMMFTYRLDSGAWTQAWSNKSADGRTQSQSGSTVNITYQNSTNAQGIRNFRVNESYSLVSDSLV